MATTLVDVLDTVRYAHDGGLLPFFSTAEAATLRVVCTALRDHVSDFPWRDGETEVLSRFAEWRRSFPHARVVSVTSLRGTLLGDADFARLAGVQELTVRRCCLQALTGAAFAVLHDAALLDLSRCFSISRDVTDAALVHLRGFCAVAQGVGGAGNARRVRWWGAVWVFDERVFVATRGAGVVEYSRLDPVALVALASLPVVRRSAALVRWVADVVSDLALSNGGAACTAAGVPQLLVGLAALPAVQLDDHGALREIASAIYCVALVGDDSVAALLAAGAPAALVTLAENALARDALTCDLAEVLVGAFSYLCRVGLDACLAADVPFALKALAPYILRADDAEAGPASFADAVADLAHTAEGCTAIVAAGLAFELVALAATEGGPGGMRNGEGLEPLLRAIYNLSSNELCRAALLSERAQDALASLAAEPRVRSDAENVALLAWSLARLAISDAADACAGALPAIASLVALDTTKGDARAAAGVALAVHNLTCSANVLVPADLPELLLALGASPVVRGSSAALEYIADSFGNLACLRKAACRAVGVVEALVGMSQEGALQSSGAAVAAAAHAIYNFACGDDDDSSDEGGEEGAPARACAAAGAIPALLTLAALPAVHADAQAARWIASAFAQLAVDGGCVAQLLAQRVPASVVSLARLTAVAEAGGEAVQAVAWALSNLSTSDSGRRACVAAGAAAALEVLARASAEAGCTASATSVAAASARLRGHGGLGARPPSPQAVADMVRGVRGA